MVTEVLAFGAREARDRTFVTSFTRLALDTASDWRSFAQPTSRTGSKSTGTIIRIVITMEATVWYYNADGTSWQNYCVCSHNLAACAIGLMLQPPFWTSETGSRSFLLGVSPWQACCAADAFLFSLLVATRASCANTRIHFRTTIFSSLAGQTATGPASQTGCALNALNSTSIRIGTRWAHDTRCVSTRRRTDATLC